MSKCIKIGLAFTFLCGGIFAGQKLSDKYDKKSASQICCEQSDIRADLKNTVPPDEFLKMEGRIGKITPKKELTNLLGIKIHNPIRRTTDFKYFQDSIKHDREIWQKAFQRRYSLNEELSQAIKDLKSLIKSI